MGPYYEKEKITALSCYQDWTFVGTERGQLSICQRAKQVTKIALPTDHAIIQIEAIGSCILILQSNNTLHQYDLDLSGQSCFDIVCSTMSTCFIFAFCVVLSNALQLAPDMEEEFFVSSFIHPSTYLNKILIATRDGAMHLWNIKTRQVECRKRTNLSLI